VNHTYTLLGLWTLDAGSWAEWVGGFTSAAAVITALAAFPLAKREKRKEERQREIQVGRAVGWKLLRVLNNTADIERHIRTSLANREPLYPPGMKFPLVRPLGVPDRPLQDINQNETDLLLKAQAADLLAEIDMCLSRYSSITYSINECKNRHEALFELMPSPVAMQDMLFTHALTKEEADRIKPYAHMLESLLDGIIALIAENMHKANAAMLLYGKDMERYFGKSLMTFELDPAVANTEN
jgi:hypothetical protein